MKKYAIIGKGFIFPRHVQAIRDTSSDLVVSCDIDPNREADFLDYREMMQSDVMNEVDTVVVCTPNHLHAEMCRAALGAGKSVLCEKPLTINTDFSFMEDVNVVLQLRYHPKFDEICEKLRKAKYVKLVLRAYRDQHFWDSWKGDELMSGGVVYIMGPHIFDLLLYALRKEGKTVYNLRNVVDGMKESSGTIEFENGPTVDFEMEFLNDRDKQGRYIDIDGEKFVLSLKDNLSFEGMHDKVYMALERGDCPKLKDVKPAIELTDSIKKFNN